MRRWLAPGALLIVAGWSLFMAVRSTGGHTPDAAAAGPRPGTPVLSVRRAAPLLSATASDVRLKTGLAAAVGRAPARTCLAVDRGGRSLFQQGVTQALIPASNMKLVTAYAVLTRMGADARFTTTVKAEHRPQSGVIDGNVYLVGSGDPVLQTGEYNTALREQELPPDGYTHLEDLAVALGTAGVMQVKGAVIGDESRYDTQRYVPTWKPEYAADSEVGPLSAVEVNDGFVTYQAPETVAAPAPAVLASGTLSALMEKRGIDVVGEPGQGTAPRGAVTIASVQSPPMATIVGQMLRESDNTTAELLTKELGRRFGEGGTTEGGVAVIRRTLADAGVPVDGLTALDGSGLDRADRATCSVLLDVLKKAGPDGRLAQGLPVAAESGTLRKRFVGTSAAGRVAAKTGSLDHVAALSGFTRGPAPLTFALVANDLVSDAAGRSLQDRVVAVLAAYPAGPPSDEIGPLAGR